VCLYVPSFLHLLTQLSFVNAAVSVADWWKQEQWRV